VTASSGGVGAIGIAFVSFGVNRAGTGATRGRALALGLRQRQLMNVQAQVHQRPGAWRSGTVAGRGWRGTCAQGVNPRGEADLRQRACGDADLSAAVPAPDSQASCAARPDRSVDLHLGNSSAPECGGRTRSRWADGGTVKPELDCRTQPIPLSTRRWRAPFRPKSKWYLDVTVDRDQHLQSPGLRKLEQPCDKLSVWIASSTEAMRSVQTTVPSEVAMMRKPAIFALLLIVIAGARAQQVGQNQNSGRVAELHDQGGSRI